MGKEEVNYEVINHMFRSRIRMSDLQDRIIDEFITKEEKYAPLENFSNRAYLADRISKFLSRHLFREEPFKSMVENAIAIDAYDVAMEQLKKRNG